MYAVLVIVVAIFRMGYCTACSTGCCIRRTAKAVRPFIADPDTAVPQASTSSGDPRGRTVGVMSPTHHNWYNNELRFQAGVQGFTRAGEVTEGFKRAE